MQNNYNFMPKEEINKMLKKNINRMMSEKGINSSDLGNKTGILQPRISKALNYAEPSAMFTAEQLIKISEVLDCSLDDLCFGKEKNNKRAKYNNLGDVFSVAMSLLELQQDCGLGQFEEEIFDEEMFEDKDFTSQSHSRYEYYPCIYFKSIRFQLFFTQYRQLNGITNHDDLKKKIYELWKEDAIQKLSLFPIDELHQPDKYYSKLLSDED